MGQYLQFQSWLRNSSGAEKALAGTAFAVVVGLTAWALVPPASSGDDNLSIGDTPAGQGPGAVPGPSSSSGTGTGPGTGTGSVPGTGTVPGGGTGPGGTGPVTGPGPNNKVIPGIGCAQ